MTDEDEQDEATQAFQELTREVADVRAELSVMRRAVEGVGSVLGEARAPDYSPTLAQISSLQKAIVVAITKIEQHPALRVAPEVQTARTAHAIEEAVRGPLREAERAARTVQGSAQAIEGALGAARARQAQNTRLAQAAAIGVVAGLVLFPLVVFPLARALPGGLSDTLATWALGEGAWSAGMGLTERANPAEWAKVVEGYRRSEAGGDELRACYEALRRTGKEQKCTVTLRPAPSAVR